jgi:hypothetical protein
MSGQGREFVQGQIAYEHSHHPLCAASSSDVHPALCIWQACWMEKTQRRGLKAAQVKGGRRRKLSGWRGRTGAGAKEFVCECKSSTILHHGGEKSQSRRSRGEAGRSTSRRGFEVRLCRL